MQKTEYLTKEIQKLDDPAFMEVADAITDRAAETESKPNDEIIHIHEIEEEIRTEYNSWGKVKGLSTGYTSLDERLGGLGNGHVIIIGGDTHQGKSALAANIAVNVAKTGEGVLYITLEMLRKEIGSRIMHINNGTVHDLNMMFQAEFRLSYKDIKPLLKRAREVGEIKLVVLDYLQYLGRGMKPEEVAVMSKEMKTLALEHEIPFIVIVSLRKQEQGKQKRVWTQIEIEDFMGTGAIGYDCDSAMVASRRNMDNEYDANGFYVKILKTRNTRLDYDKRYLQFNWSETRIKEEWKEAGVTEEPEQQGFIDV